jgi:hypothetical protein
MVGESETLLKTDKVTVALEALPDGKIRLAVSALPAGAVLLADQKLEVRWRHGQISFDAGAAGSGRDRSGIVEENADHLGDAQRRFQGGPASQM